MSELQPGGNGKQPIHLEAKISKYAGEAGVPLSQMPRAAETGWTTKRARSRSSVTGETDIGGGTEKATKTVSDFCWLCASGSPRRIGVSLECSDTEVPPQILPSEATKWVSVW
ncbi:UNVERIFIED_CONTAM: hypothetical protein K2H54_010277 [Gekko kuhli]